MASEPRLQTHTSIASAVLLLLTGLALAALSHFEHAKSIRPSYLIEGYLLLTAIFDVARVRTEWLLETNDAVAGIVTGSLVTKCIMLALEAMAKRSILPDQSFSREGSGGLLNRMSFWWLNHFMLTGFRKVLAVDDLPEIHEKLDSERLANIIQTTWQNCRTPEHGGETPANRPQATKRGNMPWQSHVYGLYAGRWWVFTYRSLRSSLFAYVKRCSSKLPPNLWMTRKLR